jgi:hypothetical protein
VKWPWKVITPFLKLVHYIGSVNIQYFSPLVKEVISAFKQNCWVLCSSHHIAYVESFLGYLLTIFSLSAADRMCRSGAVDIICIDSVSALTPRAEIEVQIFEGVFLHLLIYMKVLITFADN